MAYWFAETTVDARVLELVRALRAGGTKGFVATNQERERTNYLREELGLGKAFDGIYASCELGCTKNDPTFFKRILAKESEAAGPPSGRRITPERALFVDHDEENLAAARKAGLATYHYDGFDAFARFMAAG